jgi:hypothetical protein
MPRVNETKWRLDPPPEGIRTPSLRTWPTTYHMLIGLFEAHLVAPGADCMLINSGLKLARHVIQIEKTNHWPMHLNNVLTNMSNVREPSSPPTRLQGGPEILETPRLQKHNHNAAEPPLEL